MILDAFFHTADTPDFSFGPSVGKSVGIGMRVYPQGAFKKSGIRLKTKSLREIYAEICMDVFFYENETIGVCLPNGFSK